MKNSLYSIWNLFSNSLNFNIKNKKNIGFFIFLIMFILATNVTWVILFNMNNLSTFLYLWSNIIQIINSVLITLFCLYTASQIFIFQKNNGLFTMEKRYGYKTSWMYISKILCNYSILIAFYFITFFISIIFYLSISKVEYDMLVYQNYISSYGWYFLIIFLIPIILIFWDVFVSGHLSIILSTIFSYFIILLPMLQLFFSLMNNSNNDIKNDEYISFKYQLKNTTLDKLKSNEISNKVLEELEDVYLTQYDKFYQGPRIFDTSNTPTYLDYFSYIEEQLKNIKEISYNDISDFSTKTVKFKEPVNILLENIKVNNEFKSLNSIYFDFLQTWNILNDLENNYNRIPIGVEKKTIQEEYENPALYFFIKTFNSMIEFSISANDFTKTIITPAPWINVIDQQKDYLLNNILNPIAHFNLMFHSTNYTKNTILIEQIALKNIFVSKSYNLKIEQNNGNLIFSKLLYVELIFFFYFIFGILVLLLLYFYWKKKQ